EFVGEQFDDPAPHGGYEFWTILFQRAYLDELVYLGHTGEQVGSSDLDMNAMRFVSDDTLHHHFYTDDWDDPALMRSHLLGGGMATGCASDGSNALVIPGHCYALVAVNWDAATGKWWATLYNPWGKDNDGQPPSDGVDDGLITIEWSAMYSTFNILTNN